MCQSLSGRMMEPTSIAAFVVFRPGWRVFTAKFAGGRYNRGAMSDRLYLSCWVRGYTGAAMLRHFETLLGLFPFSKLARHGALLNVYAVEHAEPAVREHDFAPGASPAEIVGAAAEFVQPDCSVEVDAEWDLWQFGDKGWELRP